MSMMQKEMYCDQIIRNMSLMFKSDSKVCSYVNIVVNKIMHSNHILWLYMISICSFVRCVDAY